MLSFRRRPRRLAAALAALLAAAVTSPLGGSTPASAGVTGQGKTTCKANSIGAMTCSGTFSGARAFNPSTGRPIDTTPQATVSASQNLSYQSVHVSWSGFTPSSGGFYDVGIFECRGSVNSTGHVVPDSAPQSIPNPFLTTPLPDAAYQKKGSCYKADTDGNSWSGAANRQIVPTGANGTGAGDIPIETAFENTWLGCDEKHPCWLVIVPNWGGNPSDCSDHSWDTSFLGNFADDNHVGDECSWSNRIAVPLHFVATPSQCPAHSAALTAQGSPTLLRGMAQWQSGWCRGASGVGLTFNGGVDEYQSRQMFLHGSGALASQLDAALVTQPASKKDAASSPRPFTYAPLANTSIAIAYYLDDFATKKPITGLRLNARLVAKLLTQSYSLQWGACDSAKTASAKCDPAVAGNPVSILVDPEFLALNPKLKGHDFSAAVLLQQGGFLPTVVAGNSDLVHELTRWIASDSKAAAFMSGKGDGYGMHVNTHYGDVKYPVDKLEALDPGFTGKDNTWTMQSTWFPKTGLDQVAATLVRNRNTAVDWVPFTGSDTDKTKGAHYPYPTEAIGQRALFAIVSGADAAAFNFPVAEIKNATGDFVTPTTAAVSAAVANYKTNADNVTQQANYASTNSRAYPLTMTSYAMVATCGYSKTKATNLSSLLSKVAGGGQTAGFRPGQLAPGYAALTAVQKRQTRAAASKVSTSACPRSSSADNSSAGGSGQGSSSSGGASGTSSGTKGGPDAGLAPSANAAAPAGKPTQAPVTVDYGMPSNTGANWTKWVAPVAAIVFALLLLGGGGFYLAGGGGGRSGSVVRNWFGSVRRRFL